MVFNMKNIIFVFAFLYSCFLSAQGSLQYNQTKFIKLSASGVFVGGINPQQFYGVDSLTITVPIGKTLKIESANVGGLTSGSGTTITSYPNRATYAILSLDNTMIAYASYGGSYTEPNLSFPIWLPAGNYKLQLNTAIGSASDLRINGFISAIEFNIVP